MAEQPEPLEDVLSDVLDSAMAGIHTALPGRVEKYYSEDQTADVLPLIQSVRVDESGQLLASTLPVLPRVPVCHPRGGGFFVHFPLAVGDFVMLVFQEAAIDQWRAKDGRESHPADLRRHALGNAVAYPGLYPTSRKLALTSTTNLVVGADGGQQIHIQPGPTGQIRLGSAGETSLVAIADLVIDEFDRVKSDITKLKTAIGAGFTAVGVGAAANGPAGKTAFDSAAETPPTVTPTDPGDVSATRTTAL